VAEGIEHHTIEHWPDSKLNSYTASHNLGKIFHCIFSPVHSAQSALWIGTWK